MTIRYYCANEACSEYRKDSGKGNGTFQTTANGGRLFSCAACYEGLYHTQHCGHIPADGGCAAQASLLDEDRA